MRIWFIAVLGGLLLAVPAQALEVQDIRSEKVSQGEHVTIRFSKRVTPAVSLAEHGSSRVVIELPAAHWKKGQDECSSELVKAVRLTPRGGKGSRMVLELTKDVSLQHVNLVKAQHKATLLEFDIIPVSETAKAAQFQPPVREKPVVVIDAGHGGQDPGTSGVGGVKEKHITLSFAEALKEELLKSNRYRVVLTRNDDRYLFLRERVKLAREAKGNLFISIHADSAPSRHARGLSVYTISEKASDKEAEALAAKENKADVIGGIDLNATSDDVADILIDLAERETRGKSARFAKLVIRALSHEISLLSNTHRYAGFAVLKAPDIPSILVEVGFLSSRQEEKQLESEMYRKKVARGLAGAVDNYFSKRR